MVNWGDFDLVAANNEISHDDPEIYIDWDAIARIKELFREFEKVGLLAVEGVASRASDAHDLIRERYSEEWKDKSPGYVFYTDSDTLDFEEDFYIGFGGWEFIENTYQNIETGEEKIVIESDDEETIALILKVIVGLEMFFEWNGNRNTRIKVRIQNGSEE